MALCWNRQRGLPPPILYIIDDLLNVLYYPVIGRIKGIENISQGTPCWYTVEYKNLKINPKAKKASERILSGEKFFTVRRPLQSLLLLSPHSSYNNQVTTDIIDSVPGIVQEDGEMIRKNMPINLNTIIFFFKANTAIKTQKNMAVSIIVDLLNVTDLITSSLSRGLHLMGNIPV